MRRSRVAFALGVVVPLLLVGGCSGDDPEPRVAPPASTSPSDPVTSPTPTGPVEPTMPAAAKKQTAAGAMAFVQFYWDTVNYAQVSGVLEPLVALSSKNCGACSGGVGFLRRIFNGGGDVRGGEVTLSNLKANKVSAGKHAAWQVLVDVTSTRQFVDMPGKHKDKTFPAGTVSLQIIVDPRPGGWTVGYWDKAPA